MWKILNIIAILIVGGAGYVAYLNRDALKQEKELFSRAEDNREQTQAWYRRAGEVMKEREGKRDGLIAEREAAEAELKEREGELAAAQSDLAMTKSQIADKQAELDAKKQTIAKFGGFEETFAKVEALTDSIASLTESIAGMKQKKAVDIAALESTDVKIQDYQNLELWQKTGKMKSLSANVVMISPEFRFVIIDAGVGRGVVSRAKLDVLRGGAKIGELRVAVIEPTRSVCNIESVVPGETIQPGDRVVVSEESKPTDKDVATAGEAGAEATPSAPAASTGTDSGTAPAMEDAPAAPAAGEDPFGGLSTEGLDPGVEPEAEAPADGAEEAPADGAEEAPDDAADPFGA